MDRTNTTIESYSAVKQILQVYGGLLLFVGIPANIVTIIVLKQGMSTRTTTRALMMFLAFGDTAVLSTAVLRYWLRWIFTIDIRSLSRFACKSHAFSVGFFSDFAVGTLCVIATERFLLVVFPHRANTLVTNKTVLVGVSCFVGLILVKNCALFWLFDLEGITKFNSTVIVCKGDSVLESYVDAFTRFDFTTYSIVPYIILFTCNVTIFCKLRHQRRLMHNRKPLPTRTSVPNGDKETIVEKGPTKRKPESIVKVLTVLTIIHAVTTLPGSTFILLKIYFRLAENKTVEERKQLNLLNDSLLMLVFTNNAINFVAYMASSTPFRENFYKIFVNRWLKSTPDEGQTSQAQHRRTLLGLPTGQSELSKILPSKLSTPEDNADDAEDKGNGLSSAASIPLMVQIHNENCSK